MKYQVERSRPVKICCLLGSSQGTYLDSFRTLVEQQQNVDFCQNKTKKDLVPDREPEPI